MIVPTPRCACLVLLASAFLPLGAAHAQRADQAAVGRRLRAAIAAGELSPAQAKAMMAVLAKQSRAKRPTAPARMNAYITKVRKELGAAVRAGKITRREAGEKYEAALRGIKARMAGATKRPAARGSKRAKIWLRRVKQRLEQAVKAGKITKEAASKRYEHAVQSIKKRMEAGRRPDRDRGASEARRYLGELKKKLDAAIKAGRITKAQSREKFEAAARAVRKKISEGRLKATAKKSRKR